MRKTPLLLIVVFCLIATNASARGEDLSGPIRKVVEKSTLDEPRTRPFHLKATYAPSFDRDKGSNRTGEVEIWWQSPTKWRREVRSPEFHQIAIVDGDHQWQKNDGDYFPEWLRELAAAIVRPVPLSPDVLAKRVKTAEVRRLARQVNLDWDAATEFDNEQANGHGYLATTERMDSLLYTGGPGWSGQFKDFHDFHGRMIAYTVSSGNIEVTAKVSVLQDLGDIPPGAFDTTAPGGDPQPIDTVILSKDELTKYTLPGTTFEWPSVLNGPFEGVVWTNVVLDRSGKVREMIPPISDNPGLRDAAEKSFRSMQFQPVLRNGVPVQAAGVLSVRFKTGRPAGVESFDSPKVYFERGRKASYLAAGGTAPYSMRAEFQIATKDGVRTGRYEDTWVSTTEWKREAWFGASHFARSRTGEQDFLVSEGAESGMLRLILEILEPIPATDTMTESDWRISRDNVDSSKAIRVFRGPEGPNGELDPHQSEGFWFDDSGHLVKCYMSGFEIRPSGQQAFNGVQVARRIDVLKDGHVGMRIDIKDIGPSDSSVAKAFKLKGHEWQRAFTAEVR
jgi:hypothetical protein